MPPAGAEGSHLSSSAAPADRWDPSVSAWPMLRSFLNEADGRCHLTAANLVALSRALYGRAADVFAVSCGVQSLEIGDRLSPVVDAALPRLVDAVAGLVASRARLRQCLMSERGAETSDGPPATRAVESEPNG